MPLILDSEINSRPGYGVRCLMSHHVEVLCEWPEDLRYDHYERCQPDKRGLESRQRRLGRAHI